MSVLVKICGIRTVKDARLAVSLGASHVGVVLAPGSPRHVTVSRLTEVVETVGDSATAVLVCRDLTVRSIVRAARTAGVTRIQPHGMGRAGCRALEQEGFILHRVVLIPRGAGKLPDCRSSHPEGLAVLDGGTGGQGKQFDWGLLAAGAPTRTFVAGGITPGNVQEVLRYKPYGIDLCSGVESRPGVKDGDLMRRLFAAVKGAR